MADEDLLGTMDDLGGEGGEEEGQGGGGSPLMKYLPLIGGALVVQIVIAYFVASWWFVPSEVPPEAVEGQVAAEEVKEEKVKEMAPTEVAVVYEKLDAIVVNPAGTEGLRFLSATIHLGLSSPDVEALIDQKKLASKITDKLIDVLRSKTIGQLEPGNHEALKTEIKDKLNVIMGGKPGMAPPVVEVYFKGFVLQ
ncbi:MAG: flagellar basal body-associated FliL family protein [bacterium]|nr:flagellar basal body-associated FliL family protein [bacterium]